jgi:3-oxoacyl-[acyl-carrier protein] reductase
LFRLDGRVAVVTGAASGIGAATARIFAEAGADVALAWYPNDPHDVTPVVRAVEACGRRALSLETDVRRTEDVDRLVAGCIREFGRVDIAVGNAGIAPRVSLENLDDVAWNATVDVNMTGVWRLFRAVLPHMRRSGYGRLIATSSEVGTVTTWNDHTHYAATKAALVGIVQNLAVQYGPDGITANAVAPGNIATPQSLDPVNSLGPEGVRAVATHTPVRRVGEPEDVAYLYRYLASEEAGFLSGQLLVIDGAMSLTNSA